MGEVPLSLHVPAQLKEELEQEARLLKMSESKVAERAIEAYLNLQAHKRDVIAAAAKEADKGVFISSEAILEWMKRLESDINAPAPAPDVILPPRK
ncbi:ribbon-helix-helix protein, CopG family [Pseudaminobacter sp. 19-2017]|uniref:Ribbon-helix-helix protein, CopG family n=1 Tax=Pseudaminobacter soli (ex Zhang et al. 2022) TaxID=2831468 RepID=A0A942E4X9_9HYPH|nr:ribbon-helix-helix protein, CopG family [Pseudaminobacter soli]MBS3651233.1 ribbon-helix-helix protein, CopG family [Pseudaminobacter soli]